MFQCLKLIQHSFRLMENRTAVAGHWTTLDYITWGARYTIQFHETEIAARISCWVLTRPTRRRHALLCLRLSSFNYPKISSGFLWKTKVLQLRINLFSVIHRTVCSSVVQTFVYTRSENRMYSRVHCNVVFLVLCFLFFINNASKRTSELDILTIWDSYT